MKNISIAFTVQNTTLYSLLFSLLLYVCIIRLLIYVFLESELCRLLRTEVYNKRSDYTIKDMLESDIFVLHGPQIQSKRKLLRYSPLIEELIYSECNFQALSLGNTFASIIRVNMLD